MNRAEFLRRLTELLSDVSPTEREEAIQYYNDYFDDAGVENESGVIASLGTPEELARTIKAGLSDGGAGGEFTEAGFSGYAQTHRDELMKTGEGEGSGTGNDGAARQSGGGWSGNAGQQSGPEWRNGTGAGVHSGDAYYQGGYYQRNGNDSVYGGREDTRRQENPYEKTAAGNAASGGQYAQPKKGMSGGTIALLVILAVLTSPIWLGLLGAFFGLAIGVLATLFGVFACFLVAGIGLVIVAFALLIAGFAMLFTIPLGGVCMIGSALIVFAIGLVFVWLMVLMAGLAIPAFVRGVGALCRRLFGRGGARA